MSSHLTSRRRFLGGAAGLAAGLTAGLVLPGVTGSAGAAAPSRRITRLTMPTPTGPAAIGTCSLRLVDPSRQDPWLTTPTPREVRVTLWYPARGASEGDLAPWMLSGALAHYRPELTDFLNAPTGPGGTDGGPGGPNPPPPSDSGTPLPPPPSGSSLPPPPSSTPQSDSVSLDGVRFPITHARRSAPFARSPRPFPVVLYSPGFAFDPEYGTFVAEELASYGYVVVTIGHTYDAAELEFPDGRVVLGRHDLDNAPSQAMLIRRDDTRFVLDQLARLNSTVPPRDPALPVGISGSLDLTKIGMFGHSLGGATTAQTMAHDERIVAGVNLDGSIFTDVDPMTLTPTELQQQLAGVATRIGQRPFLFMASGGFGPDYFGILASAFWYALPGWRRFVSIVGTTHFSYTDLLPLLSELADAKVIPSAPQVVPGSLDAVRAVAMIRIYIRTFFDLHLRGLSSTLLDGPSPAYPEAKFYN